MLIDSKFTNTKITKSNKYLRSVIQQNFHAVENNNILESYLKIMNTKSQLGKTSFEEYSWRRYFLGTGKIARYKVKFTTPLKVDSVVTGAR